MGYPVSKIERLFNGINTLVRNMLDDQPDKIIRYFVSDVLRLIDMTLVSRKYVAEVGGATHIDITSRYLQTIFPTSQTFLSKYVDVNTPVTLTPEDVRTISNYLV